MAAEQEAKQSKEEVKGFDYEKENECCLCKCPLYEGLQEANLADVIKEQKKIRNKKMKEEDSAELIPVVRMGECQGMHFYHKECIEG